MKTKSVLPQSLADWLASLPVTIPPNWENTPEAKLAEAHAEELPEFWQN